MPTNNGVRLHDRQRIANFREQPIETNEYQAVDGAEGEFFWSSSPQNVYLLPQSPNLCLECCPRPDQIDNRPTNKPEKIPHYTTSSPDSPLPASRMRFTTGTTATAAVATAMVGRTRNVFSIGSASARPDTCTRAWRRHWRSWLLTQWRKVPSVCEPSPPASRYHGAGRTKIWPG